MNKSKTNVSKRSKSKTRNKSKVNTKKNLKLNKTQKGGGAPPKQDWRVTLFNSRKQFYTAYNQLTKQFFLTNVGSRDQQSIYSRMQALEARRALLDRNAVNQLHEELTTNPYSLEEIYNILITEVLEQLIENSEWIDCGLPNEHYTYINLIKKLLVSLISDAQTQIDEMIAEYKNQQRDNIEHYYNVLIEARGTSFNEKVKYGDLLSKAKDYLTAYPPLYVDPDAVPPIFDNKKGGRFLKILTTINFYRSLLFQLGNFQKILERDIFKFLRFENYENDLRRIQILSQPEVYVYDLGDPSNLEQCRAKIRLQGTNLLNFFMRICFAIQNAQKKPNEETTTFPAWTRGSTVPRPKPQYKSKIEVNDPFYQPYISFSGLSSIGLLQCSIQAQASHDNMGVFNGGGKKAKRKNKKISKKKVKK